MQNLLLLHLREQMGINLKEIEQRTGIPLVRYQEYEQGVTSVHDSDAELLSCLFNIKAIHLKEYSRQLEYFSYCKSMLQLKDKRIEELVAVLKLYLKEGSKPKQRSKPKKTTFKKQNNHQ